MNDFFTETVISQLSRIIELLEKFTAETEMTGIPTVDTEEEVSFDADLVKMIHEEVERGFTRLRQEWIK